MAGCRMISESICIDKRLSAVSEGAENLFYRLLSTTDDVGDTIGEPELIKGQIYPRRGNLTLEDIKSRLLELHNIKNNNELGLIDLYHYGGEIYVHFPNFNKYQKLRKDINPKITFPLRTCNNTLRTCNDPFTQVSKVSKKVSKEVLPSDYLSKDNIKILKTLFNDGKALVNHLTMLGYGSQEISKVLA